MRVLVTGATGYLGRVVVDQFQQADYGVAALVRGAAALPATVEQRCGELLDPCSLAAAVDDVDAMLHLAALTGARASVALGRLLRRRTARSETGAGRHHGRKRS